MEADIVIYNECSQDKIADAYLPIIDDATAACCSVFADSITNIRLSGSVARGEAIIRHSDIDFIAILGTQPTREQQDKITGWERGLQQKYPVVSKVDLEIVMADELNDFRQFVLATDSISVFGRDLYPQKSQVVNRQYLAEMVTPDLKHIIESYRHAVVETDESNDSLLFFYSRLIGKDILKCLRYTSLTRGGRYERSIHKIYTQLLQYAPEHQELVHELHELYSHPSKGKERLLTILEKAQSMSAV